MITREEARQIGLKCIEGKDDNEIYCRAAQPPKNTWTVGEYRKALINDTELENHGKYANPIDGLIHLEEYLNERGRSLKTNYIKYPEIEKKTKEEI